VLLSNLPKDQGQEEGFKLHSNFHSRLVFPKGCISEFTLFSTRKTTGQVQCPVNISQVPARGRQAPLPGPPAAYLRQSQLTGEHHL
jgi:hypothetical protein